MNNTSELTVEECIATCERYLNDNLNEILSNIIKDVRCNQAKTYLSFVNVPVADDVIELNLTYEIDEELITAAEFKRGQDEFGHDVYHAVQIPR